MPGLWKYPYDLLESEEYGHAMLFTAWTPEGYLTAPASQQGQMWLYIPGGGQNNLMYSQNHEYDEVKMSRLGAGIMASILGMGVDTSAGGSLAAAGAAAFRKAINPKVEVLFRSTDLRSFDFSFMFAPQSKEESKELYQMLTAFRYFSAPQVENVAPDVAQAYLPSFIKDDGLLFQSPFEWTINFLYRNKTGSWAVNPNLPKIDKGVISRIDVDMNPDAEFSTFENGDPTSARLTIRFTELRIIDKSKIQQGF